MKRLKYLFAGCLLLLAMPMWRYIDTIAIVVPFELLYALAMALWAGVFLMIPLKLIRPTFKTTSALALVILIGFISYLTGPLSKMATKESDFNHCGVLTYTGMTYPMREFLTEAYRDDLEARNQMCWVRKMILRVPEKIDGDHEVQVYSKLIEDRLLAPEVKYRVTLPLIAVLFIKINTAGTNFQGAKNIYNSLHFWIDHYTEEISNRKYSWWNWPHSDYIQFEYGLVEKNWQDLINSIVVQ